VCSSECGDEIVAGDEVCDGSALGGETCQSHGYVSGTLGCLADCEGYETTNCSGMQGGSTLTWVSIPGGTYEMGSMIGDSDEQPVHSVTVSGFEMTKTEVTVQQYRACVVAGACTAPPTGGSCNWNEPGYEDHPVNCVDWSQAVTFCAWAGGRLPSEAEWEYAARSEGQDIEYPWGDDAATCTYAVMGNGSTYGCGTGRTMAACSKPAGNTAQGLCDMAGNVWEWVEDWYHDSYAGAPSDGSAWTGPPGSARVLRGGSYYNFAVSLRVASRNYHDPSYQGHSLGFRCGRVVAP